MNQLQYEKSPYLRQHMDNPVRWYPWKAEAFEKAKREDKPIFLSIGYSTCHWCHVMAHESFEDETVAEILNRDYICIKVDREERPDVDAVYMAVCQALTGSGGWPLTVLMTPEQKPFFAGTYFPKRQRYGQPGLIEILQQIGTLWREKREELLKAGNEISDFVKTAKTANATEPEKKLLKQAFTVFVKQYDQKWGGFGRAPKFPVPHNLMFLLRYGKLSSNEEALKMAEHTLTAMACGGIFDQIGGGFSRYSTDEKWLAPHFEKMLYDNALLSIVYMEAWQVMKNPLFLDIAVRTLDYMSRELSGEKGEFYCGQDADSEGEEGKYYLFKPEEIVRVLGREDAEEFCRIYDITKSGNFEGKSIPNRIGCGDTVWKADDERLKKLYEYRKTRTELHMDDKVILSWNAWAVIAFAKAARILEKEAYLDAAVNGCKFIRNHMTDKDERLYLRWREGEAAYPATLDDYAVYGLALLELYRTTFETEYLLEAVCRGKQILKFFEDSKLGGYFLTALDAEELIARPKETYDGALPSGNSAAAVLFGRLAKYTGEVVWQEVSERQNGFLAGIIGQNPLGCSFGLIALIEALYPSKEVICATAKEEMPRELSLFMREQWNPNLFVMIKTRDNTEALAKIAPFTRSYPVPKQDAMFYLCENGMCSAPKKIPGIAY